MVQMQSVKARKKKSSALNKEGENNKYESTDEDDYKRAREEVIKLGLNPDSIKHHKTHH